MKKTICMIVLLGVLTTGLITAFAARAYPEGGTWDYGEYKKMVLIRFILNTFIIIKHTELRQLEKQH